MPLRRSLLLASSAAALARVLPTTAAAAVAATAAATVAKAAVAIAPPPAVPSEVAPALPKAQWAGAARLRFFGFDVYDARLWVVPGFQAAQFAQHGLALELTYLRTLSGRDIAQRSLQEMAHLARFSAAQSQRWLTALQNALPDVKPGERLVGLHSPSVGAQFWHQGQPRPSVSDPEFSRLFFGIWLAPATREPQMRLELLSELPA